MKPPRRLDSRFSACNASAPQVFLGLAAIVVIVIAVLRFPERPNQTESSL